MNRIIILGNGFDIAHGLKTKYSDFINDYYQNIWNSEHDDEFMNFSNKNFDLTDLNTFSAIRDYFPRTLGSLKFDKNSRKYFLGTGHVLINIKNKFFHDISLRCDAQWVDIEIEYFKQLIEILDGINPNSIPKKIAELNKEVDEVAKKFEQYLIANVQDEIESKRINQISILFRDAFLSRNNLEEFLREFPENYSKTVRANYQNSLHANPGCDKFQKTLILNFNYTQTASILYKVSIKNCLVINIHGTLGSETNPINLGFGDESNPRYLDLEDANDNEYLRLMKSFSYTSNDNYRQLFDFVETDDFQVQVMGHSCGLSDRTLLKAIFENKLCRSIKIFYHEYSMPDEFNQKNNHSQIVRNISRHFSAKTTMRNKIVNETLCQKLPQYQQNTTSG